MTDVERLRVAFSALTRCAEDNPGTERFFLALHTLGDVITAIELNETLRNRICAQCGHPSDWHRFDDAQNIPTTDPKARFRCLGYDCEASGPPPEGGTACNCPNFAEQP